METKTERKHTPTPWRWVSWGERISIDAKENAGIATINPQGDADKGIPCRIDRANTDFIVRACNSHDDLLAALKESLDQIEYLRRQLTDRKRRFVAATTNRVVEIGLDALKKARG